MKPSQPVILVVAATLSLFPVSLLAQASTQNGESMSGTNSSSTNSYNTNSNNTGTPNTNTARGEREATRMVPARAKLLEKLDAKKMQAGETFKAQLQHKVKLDNGPELPGGTILEGTVAKDDMSVSGNSKLVLRFTQADLKDGQTVPIKATIVGLYPPDALESGEGYLLHEPNTWNDGTLAVDQLQVEKDVDLHSKIASRNSGVFVTTTKDDVKLGDGSQLNLAIAEARGQQNTSGSEASNQPSGY